MRTPHRIWQTALCVTASLILSLSASAQRQAVSTQSAAPVESPSLGSLPTSQGLNFSLSLPLRNEAGLKTFLKQLRDPKSPNYKKFLTAAQFNEQYGPTEADYQKVVSYAKAHGLTVTHTFANRLTVNVRASASTVNQTFQVKMQRYQHPTESRTYYAPNVNPTVEAGIPIAGINGLNTLHLPHPMLKRSSSVESYATTGSGEDGQYLGSDMRAAYAPGVTLDGTGQTLGLVELGPYNLSDVQRYFSTINQSLNVPIYNVLLSVDGLCQGTPSTDGCDDGEEVLDIEQAISMAPNLSGLIVYEAYDSGSDALTAFTQAASDGVVKQLSLSFGWGGTPDTEPGYEAIFMELAAQGQNVFVASGDAGANVGDVGYPGNSTYITAVGGTDLVTSGAGGTWQSETAWIGSGGGWNTSAPIASYQIPVITSANQGSTSYRNIPDVAMEANTDNYICDNGSCGGGLGGTSAAAPRWAGFLALANQQANGVPVGFLNETVYALGQSSTYNTVFHDITEGDNFNTTYPNNFSAETGYDLTSGWGTPTGQPMIDALAPTDTTSANFSLASSQSTVLLNAGGSGTAAITVTPLNGFSGTVTLSAAVMGGASGATVSLDQTSIEASGSATLTVSTTGSLTSGNYLVAVTGTSGGITHTVYIKLGLPYFTLSTSSDALYVNQSGNVTDTITVVPQNGFSGSVALSVSGLPEGVTARFSPSTTSSTSTLTLVASANATTGTPVSITVNGVSGTSTQTIPSLTLAVSAAASDRGIGVPVDLSAAYNVQGLSTDGTTYTNGGMDGEGYALSSTLLGTTRVLNSLLFNLGKPGVLDAVYGTGQTITLPQGKFASLQFLGTGIDGDQAAQAITVTYTDGSVSQYSQGFSDWYTPANNVNEQEAVAMSYRNEASGSKDSRSFNLYAYTLLLDPSKQVKSVTLPQNRDVLILAATLSPLSLGTTVDLSSAFNIAGIYTDGSTFADDGGVDGGGAAYSATLLGNASGASDIVVGKTRFSIAAPNVVNAVYGTGTAIPLPPGRFTTLHLLATGLDGGQESQSVVVTYTDGSSSKLSQSFSDWYSPARYTNEETGVKMAYRIYNDGSEDARTFYVYAYNLHLNPFKSVKSIQLPSNRDVVALSMTLSDDIDMRKGWQQKPRDHNSQKEENEGNR